jgi:uncharacterized protein (DUF2062 family)
MTADTTKPTQQNPDPAPKRSLWQRRVRDPIVAQLTQGVTPDKIALTLAVGVACGLFPCLGTWILCLAAAFIFKLNHPIIQIVNQLLWPVHIPAIPFYFSLGAKAFHLPGRMKGLLHILSPEHTWGERLQSFFSAEFWGHFGAVFLAGVFVWVVSVPFIIVCIYFPVRQILRKFLALRHARAAKSQS